MKVLHYKTNFLNSSETFIKRLIENHNHYTPFALCYKKKSFTESLTVYEVPQTGFESWLNAGAFHLNLSLPYYLQVLDELKPDVIHAHFGYDAAKLMNLAQKQEIPLVVSFYGSDVSRLPSEFGWKRRYSNLTSKGAWFIAATDFMKSQLLKLGFPEEKISVVRFGLNMDEFKYREHPLPHQKIMMVGRMVEKKGFEYGIRAVSNLVKKGIKPELNIYGDGPLMDSLKNLTTDRNMTEHVCFHGYKPVETIRQAHDENTIMLAPSVTAKDGDMEGLPNTILEAMAKGTPVVATKHAAIPEAIEDKKTGFLTEERNVEELSHLLQMVFEKKFNLDEIRKNARIFVEKEHDIQRMVREVEQIYDRVTHNKTGTVNI